MRPELTEIADYYLKPVLKEYTFNPASISLDLNEGERKNLEFEATRVSFSVFGQVKTLNGNLAKQVTVEAIGPQVYQFHPHPNPQGLYEETKSESTGSFRLRGLLPATEYTIRTKISSKDEKDGHVERVEPESLVLKMKNADVLHVDFVTFLKESKYASEK